MASKKYEEVNVSDLDPRGEYKNNWIIGSLRANIKGTFYTLRRFCGNIFMRKDLLATFFGIW